MGLTTHLQSIFYYLANLPWTSQYDQHIDVSKNSGTPKSWILTGFSIINHPFWGTPLFLETPIHPGKLTWNLQITHFERKMIWTKPPWGHVPAVNLPGCISITWEVHPKPCTLVPSNWLCLWLVSTSWVISSPNSRGHCLTFGCGEEDFPQKKQDMFGGRLEIATYDIKGPGLPPPWK